ncbi:LysR family transcriptional regulator [Clostridium magnum]|uniref:HTH-type transcriptional regulator CysL n=1 Tax=Clostridium magnum DSM 2767 TaxID=1121326 RepID=A0A162RVZ0_9CLOT|nr:LysR family transcriptional regulator [Clostridium magnum]KZL90449.1 HTH-type transcriptional regulator CysL [Clostridium magnum DSM 2767]SHH85452.1 DNA-binding transcriptional regulator, LysR family [Clostridium magnum DSM 2767]
MDEKDYELILTLYQLKNITKTAEKLFITQPALTKRIKKIEHDLGTELLLRSKKGVLFTPLGESIIPYIRNVASTLKQMRQQVDSNHDFIGGTLSAGISLNYSQYQLPKVLKSYTEAFPNVDVNIITDQSRNLYHRLENDEISIAVVRGEFNWNDKSILLDTEPMCLVCSNEYARRPLNSYSYIGRRSDSILQGKIQTWLTENGLSTDNTKLSIDNIGTCLEMAKHGLGWAILPKVCLDDFDGYVEDLYFADGTPFTRSTYILYRSSYYSLPQVKLFIQYLKDGKKFRNKNKSR